MDYQMGRETLKHMLSQQVRLLEHDFTALNRGSAAWNELQVRSLETLIFNSQRLISSVEALPDGPVSQATIHELRNQLTVVGGFAQMMLLKRAGDLSAEATAHLQSIALMVTRINDLLENAQREVRNA